MRPLIAVVTFSFSSAPLEHSILETNLRAWHVCRGGCWLCACPLTCSIFGQQVLPERCPRVLEHRSVSSVLAVVRYVMAEGEFQWSSFWSLSIKRKLPSNWRKISLSATAGQLHAIRLCRVRPWILRSCSRFMHGTHMGAAVLYYTLHNSITLSPLMQPFLGLPRQWDKSSFGCVRMRILWTGIWSQR